MKVKTSRIPDIVLVVALVAISVVSYRAGYHNGFEDSNRALFALEYEFRARAEKAIKKSPNTKDHRIMDINPNMYGDSMNMVDARLFEKGSGRHCLATVIFSKGEFGDRVQIDGCYEAFDRDSKIVRSS